MLKHDVKIASVRVEGIPRHDAGGVRHQHADGHSLQPLTGNLAQIRQKLADFRVEGELALVHKGQDHRCADDLADGGEVKVLLVLRSADFTDMQRFLFIENMADRVGVIAAGAVIFQNSVYPVVIHDGPPNI